MSERLRVLLVIDNLDRGGAERVVVELATGLSRRGHEVGVVAAREPAPLATELDAAGVDTEVLGVEGWNLAAAVAGLRRVVAERTPQLVHAHLLFSALSVALLPGRRSGPRRLVTHHSLAYEAYPPDTWRRRARLGLEARLMRSRIDRHLAVDAAVSAHVARYLGIEAPRVVANGVSPAPAPLAASPRRLPGRPPVIVCAGTFKPEKDHATLLEAARRLTDRGLDFELRLVGAGPGEAAVRSLAAARGLGDRVQFTGAIEHGELLHELAACDVVAISSRQEGLPMVALEALSVGAPLVATAVGGVPSIVEDERSGLLVPAGDAVALADALARALGDPALRQRLGAGGRHTVSERFSAARMVAGYEAEYRRPLGAEPE
jgi:glycosyltransferase involved in cell wall biosynthesis